MADNRKISDLQQRTPQAGQFFIGASGIENFKLNWTDIAEHSSINVKSGVFTETLTISGLLVVTKPELDGLEEKINIVSGDLLDTGIYLEGLVDAVAANLVTTGITLADSIFSTGNYLDTRIDNVYTSLSSVDDRIDIVSGDLVGVSGFVNKDSLSENQVVFYSGDKLRGSNDLVFTDVGLGIFESSPSYALEIAGDVNIRGNLLTGGKVIDVISEELVISGALLTLNSGEPGAGVTTRLAGILIDRGTEPSGYFLFDELYEAFTPSHNLIVTGGHNVGIGTPSPTHALHITSGKLVGLTGEFSDSLTLGGTSVATTSDVSTVANNLFTTGQTLSLGLHSVINGLISTNANLASTGAHLHEHIDLVSGEVQGIKTTGLSTPSGDFELSLTISGNPVSTGVSAGAGGKWGDGSVGSDIYYSAGDVGIGTSDPQEVLHVTGGTILAPSGNFSESLTLNGNLVSTGLSSSLWSSGSTPGYDPSGYLYFVGRNVGIGTPSPYAKLQVNSTGDFDTALLVTGGIILAPSGEFTEGLTISGVSVATGQVGGDGGKWSTGVSPDDIYYVNGDVGIGLIDPEYSLHVAGAGAITELMTTGADFNWFEVGPALVETSGNLGATGSHLHEHLDTLSGNLSDTGAYIHLVSGEVYGIKTTGLSTQSGEFSDSLTISGNAVSTGSFQNMIAGGRWSDGVSSSSNDIYFLGLDFPAGLDPEYGNVGIGTPNPTATLHITGGKILAPSGDFTESLTISGVSVATGAPGDTSLLEGQITTLSGNLISTGTHLHEHIDLVSGEVQEIKTTGLSAKSGDFTESLTISGVSVTTGNEGKWADGIVANSIYYNNNVGVGTDSPVGLFHTSGSAFLERAYITGAGGGWMQITGADGGAGPRWYNATTLGDIYYSAGNVGVGTADPVATLHVTGGGILAPSGDFSQSLLFSGASVSTGFNIDTYVHAGIPTNTTLTTNLSNTEVAYASEFVEFTDNPSGIIYINPSFLNGNTRCSIFIEDQHNEWSTFLDEDWKVKLYWGTEDGGTSSWAGNGDMDVFRPNISSSNYVAYKEVDNLSENSTYYFSAALVSGGNQRMLFPKALTLGKNQSQLKPAWKTFNEIKFGKIYTSGLMGSDEADVTRGLFSLDSTIYNPTVDGYIIGVHQNDPYSNETGELFSVKTDKTVNITGKLISRSGSFVDTLTIDGLVGIGTSDPQASLHITGGKILSPSGDFTESLTISGVPVATGAVGGGGAGSSNLDKGYVLDQSLLTSGDGLFRKLTVTGATSLFSSGNIGIGISTVSPATKLHIYETGVDYYPRIEGADNRVGLQFKNNQDDWHILLDSSSYSDFPYGGIGFYGGDIPSNKMVIDATGRVTIADGAGSPGDPSSVSNRLSVSGSSYLESLYITGSDGNWMQMMANVSNLANGYSLTNYIDQDLQTQDGVEFSYLTLTAGHSLVTRGDVLIGSDGSVGDPVPLGLFHVSGGSGYIESLFITGSDGNWFQITGADGGGTSASNLNNGYILDQSLRTTDDGQLNTLDVRGGTGFLASGHVGIGIAAPSEFAKLHIYETGFPLYPRIEGRDNEVGLKLKNNQGNWLIWLDAPTKTFSPYGGIGFFGGAAPSNKMVIDDSGRVSISSTAGTPAIPSSSTNLLSVSGASYLEEAYITGADGEWLQLTGSAPGVSASNLVNGYELDQSLLTTGDGLLRRLDVTGSTSLFASGNVGIGTPSPATKLHIYGTGAAYFPRIEGGDNQVGLELKNNQDNWYLWLDGSNYSNFPYGGIGFFGGEVPSNKMVIDATGRVTIADGAGTPGDPSSASNRLSVSGSSYLERAYITGLDGEWFQITGEGGELAFKKWEDGSTAGDIYYSDGDVGIGTGDPKAILHITGGKILAPSGDFSESLTISGISVATGDTDTSALEGQITTLSGNLISTGAHLHDHIDLVSGEVEAIKTTGLSTPSGDFELSLTISGNPVSTGEGGVGVSNLNNGYILDQSLQTTDDGQLDSLDLTDSLTTSGYIGIGTGNPATKLHIYDPTTNVYPIIQAEDAEVGINFQNNQSIWTIFLDGSSYNELPYGGMGFFGGNLQTPKMVIDDYGRVTISDSYPLLPGDSSSLTNLLSVSGESYLEKLYITGSDGNWMQITGGAGGGGGGGTPGGSDTQVQFNDGGSFGGDSNFIFNKAGGYFSGTTGYIDQLYVTGTGFFDSSTVRVGAAAIQESEIDSSAISFSVPRSSASGILTYSGSQAVLAYDTGNRELFVRADPPQSGGASGWNKLAVTFDASAAPNIGAGKGNARGIITTASGINNIIVNSDIYHGEFNYVKFGTSSNNETGAMRQGSDGIIEAYSPAASAFQDLSVGISAIVDTGDGAPKYSDIEYTDPSTNEVYSVIDGDSDSIGTNGFPIVQGFQKPSMGANPRPLLIDGGNF